MEIRQHCQQKLSLLHLWIKYVIQYRCTPKGSERRDKSRWKICAVLQTSYKRSYIESVNVVVFSELVR